MLGLELDKLHNGIIFNLAIFYHNENRNSDSIEILNSLKNCGCSEYEKLKILIK